MSNNETSPIRILIVEDEALIAESLRSDLEDYGYELLEPALSAEEALLSLQNHEPDLVITDINLNSRMTGIDLGRLLHEKYNIPYIFLTANTDTATIKNAAPAHPQAFLSKPYQLPTLIGTIQVAIHNHRKKIADVGVNMTPSYHFVKIGNQYKKIDWSDVTHITSEGKYSLIHINDSSIPWPIRTTLESMINLLQDMKHHFVRIHRSSLVNLDFVTATDGKDVEIKKGILLPVGESFRESLLRTISLHK